jgi:nucleotide-binding universal stress UspA family protein
MSSNNSGVVVVGTDGSADSKAAVKWADQYANATGETLRLVTTWAWPRSYGLTMKCDGYLPHEEAQAISDGARAGVLTPQDRVETVVQNGAAGPALVEASEGATTLVVGSQGHSVISKVLVGSVSSYCLHHAKCPVAVVNADVARSRR